MSRPITEDSLEQQTLRWFEGLGYQTIHGSRIQPEGEEEERASFEEVVLFGRFRDALQRLNPTAAPGLIEQAVRQLTRSDKPDLLAVNRQFHNWIINGFSLEERREGEIRSVSLKVIDFENHHNNDWLVVNQFVVKENRNNRRPDIVVFLNGLPLAVLELKSPRNEKQLLKGAWNQLQTYMREIPSLFHHNEMLVISDGINGAFAGTVSTPYRWYRVWRTLHGEEPGTTEQDGKLKLEILIEGMFRKEYFLQLIRYFTVFDSDGRKTIKKLAQYHQFHAVNKALHRAVEATSERGDRRIGVIWHTQGSGKSLSMTFLAGRVIQHVAMRNPTLVILTDRNDLDDQLFTTFSHCHELLRQKPVQAENRQQLKELLAVASGGVVFTTIQKFLIEEGCLQYEQLSDRRNIVVMADEAHRSQYGMIDGFARNLHDALPNASFIGFTGTPIEEHDRNTPAIFGNYIDVYDIQRAVEDQATVKIYYETRLAKIRLREDEELKIDERFEEVTEQEEQEQKEKLRSQWSRLEAVVGDPKRLAVIALDLVEHFEARQAGMEGKGMIVCMSRRICVDLYNEIIRLRPDWHDENDEKGMLKVIMTGAANDPIDWQPHIRNKLKRRELGNSFKDSASPIKLVIVRDMWLTGFDVPSMHTMYVDKPMRGHGLMQAIARVNRVFEEKPGGLIVDYIGLADQLEKAMATYTKSGGRGLTNEQKEEAILQLKKQYEIVMGLFHGLDMTGFVTSQPQERMYLVKNAMDHLLAQDDGKKRFRDGMTQLKRAFSLATPCDFANQIRYDMQFLKSINLMLIKYTDTGDTPSDPEEINLMIKQLISESVYTEKVVDLFSAIGVHKPEVSILSEAFLKKVAKIPQKNLAVEMLRKLINDEIRIHHKTNVVKARSLKEMLEKTIKKYHKRMIDTSEILMELIEVAKEVKEAINRGENLGLTTDEVAFYDALANNESAKEVLGDDTLQQIAKELVTTVKKNLTVDWTIKQSARARLRLLVKKLLKKHGYPPDRAEGATRLVLQQAEQLCFAWEG